MTAAKGTLGVVSSTHWLASAAGMAMLESGGNAMDAAVAAGFVLQVVEPHMNGPAGDLVVMVHDARTRDVRVICGQGPAPAAATPEAFDALGLTSIPGSGLLPACVPGAFGAWLRLLAEFGTKSLADVLDAAIGHAARGFPLLGATHTAIAVMAEVFRQEWPGSAATYLAAGLPRPGVIFANPVLASTLQRIVAAAEKHSSDRDRQIEAALDYFYRGPIAAATGEFNARTKALDSTGRRHHGLVTTEDLAGWHPTVEAPLCTGFAGCEVYKPGPWTQGPVLLQTLNLLSGFDLPDRGEDESSRTHTVLECLKLALADREAWYADPALADVPVHDLLSDSYATERRRLVETTASTVLRPGAPGGRLPGHLPEDTDEPIPSDSPQWTRAMLSGIPQPSPIPAGPGDTCHVSVSDRHGNLVSATPSGGWLQSSPVIPELGFPLGTRLQMSWLTPGHPNTLAPGKRPRTTLSPNIVLRDGGPCLAFGTPGGDQQDQWGLLFLLAHLRDGLDLGTAADTPMLHTEHVAPSFAPRKARPGHVVAEADCSSPLVDGLRVRGHRVTLVPAASLKALLCAAAYDPQDRMVSGAASGRGNQARADGR